MIMEGMGGTASSLVTEGLGALGLHTHAYLSDSAFLNLSDLSKAGEAPDLLQPAAWHPKHIEVFNARSFLVTINGATDEELRNFVALLETIRPATATILIRNSAGLVLARLSSPTE